MNILRKAAIVMVFTFSFASVCLADDISTDVVVIGAGASGTSAALSAQQNGVKSVLIEKAAFPAGAGTFAGGMFAADSAQQKREKKTVDKKWLYNQYMHTSNYHANARLIMNIINNAGQTVDFLISKGGMFSIMHPIAGGQYGHRNNPHTLHGYQNGGGSKTIAALQKTYVANGGTLLFETKGIKVNKDAKGNISGVTVEDADGEKIIINAKAVIIATGGMGANKEMLVEALGVPNPPLSPVTVAQGEGVKMALDAGAKKGHVILELFATNPNYKAEPSKDDGVLWLFSEMPFLKVNSQGKRFMTEELSTEYAVNSNAVYEQPNHEAWLMIDQTSIEKMKKGGIAAIIDVFKGHENSKEEFYEFNELQRTAEIAANYKMPVDMTKFLDDALSTGAVVKASSIKELAAKMNVDAATLMGEVKRYNELSAAGKDLDFHNDIQYMYPLLKGPFYAFNTVARNIGALGGVVVNESLQAVDNANNPINGLYVVGNDATGMYGNSYVMFQGATLGFAYTSGFLAGQHAAGYAKQK